MWKARMLIQRGRGAHKQLDIYLELADLFPSGTNLLSWFSPQIFLPHLIKHAFLFDSIVGLIEDLEYHAAVKID